VFFEANPKTRLLFPAGFNTPPLAGGLHPAGFWDWLTVKPVITGGDAAASISKITGNAIYLREVRHGNSIGALALRFARGGDHHRFVIVKKKEEGRLTWQPAGLVNFCT
jgi:hypothetical protein